VLLAGRGSNELVFTPPEGGPVGDVNFRNRVWWHESFATTQRYAHLAPDAHSRVIEGWSRRRGASVAHGTVLEDAR